MNPTGLTAIAYSDGNEDHRVASYDDLLALYCEVDKLKAKAGGGELLDSFCRKHGLKWQIASLRVTVEKYSVKILGPGWEVETFGSPLNDVIAEAVKNAESKVSISVS